MLRIYRTADVPQQIDVIYTSLFIRKNDSTKKKKKKTMTIRTRKAAANINKATVKPYLTKLPPDVAYLTSNLLMELVLYV